MVLIAKDKDTMRRGLKLMGGAYHSRDCGPIVVLNGSYRASLSKETAKRTLLQPFRQPAVVLARVKANAKRGAWVPLANQGHDVHRAHLVDRGYFVAITGQAVASGPPAGAHIHFTRSESVNVTEVARLIG